MTPLVGPGLVPSKPWRTWLQKTRFGPKETQGRVVLINAWGTSCLGDQWSGTSCQGASFQETTGHCVVILAAVSEILIFYRSTSTVK